jgi:hypothetical protein
MFFLSFRGGREKGVMLSRVGWNSLVVEVYDISIPGDKFEESVERSRCREVD